MHGMQAKKLYDHQKQAENTGQDRNEKILPVLQ
jgi:hypothetical protein